MTARVACFALIASGLLPVIASAQDERVGSYVDQERPMYLEVDPLVAGETYKIRVKNIPRGARRPWALFFSTSVKVEDLTRKQRVGTLGPDPKRGGVRKFDTFVVELQCPEAIAGKTLYLQAFMRTTRGGRFSNMVTVHALEAGQGGDGGGGEPVLPIPLITQEVLVPGTPGMDRSGQPVRLGVPFAQGTIQENTDGEPELSLLGADRGQFTTLDRWPDGSVKWALVEYQASVRAGELDRSIAVDRGQGSFGGEDLAWMDAGQIHFDNTVVSGFIDPTSKQLFENLKRSGISVLNRQESNGLRFVGPDDTDWTYHPGEASIRVNGPVRAQIQLDGHFTAGQNADGKERVYVRTTIEVARGQQHLRVEVNLRHTSKHYPQSLLFRGLSYELTLRSAGPYDVRVPSVSRHGSVREFDEGRIETGEVAAVVQGFVHNSDIDLTDDPTASQYTPFVERLDSNEFAIQGVCARIGSRYFTGDRSNDYYSSVDEYSDPFYMQVNSSRDGAGISVSVERACQHWPVKLRAGGDGRISVQLYPLKPSVDDYDYPMTYATTDSRAFYLWPEIQRQGAPMGRSFRVDNPLAARAELWAYNQSEVWPWRLATPQETERFYEHAGLTERSPKNTHPSRVLFRYAGGTGGENNSWRSTRSFYQWLREGHGGAYFHALYEAKYKAEKMGYTIDDGSIADYQTPANELAATRHGKMWDGSKHTFLQSMPDVAYNFGRLDILDAAPHLAATILDDQFTSTRASGNYVPGTFGAVSCSSLAVLQMVDDEKLEAHAYEYMHHWANMVFGESNDFGVDTSTKGWQAQIGTPMGSQYNPDGLFLTKGAGKGSDWDKYGYTIQVWTDYRLTSRAYSMWSHYLEENSPGDPLIADLNGRAGDIYHFTRRAFPDDHLEGSGDQYIHDVFTGDGGDPYPDKLGPPGDEIKWPSQTGYALHGICNFFLDQRASASAYSYGVEMARSMSENTSQVMISDPYFTDFVVRYLEHYGLLDL